MCNEYRFKQSLDKIAEEFSRLHTPLHWAGGAPNLEPRDSIRPTDPAAERPFRRAITETPRRNAEVVLS